MGTTCEIGKHCEWWAKQEETIPAVLTSPCFLCFYVRRRTQSQSRTWFFFFSFRANSRAWTRRDKPWVSHRMYSPDLCALSPVTALLPNEIQQWCSSPSKKMESAGNIEMIPGQGEALGLCHSIRDTGIMKVQRTRVRATTESRRVVRALLFPVLYLWFLCEFPPGIPRDNFLPALGMSGQSATAQSSTSVCSARDSTLHAALLRMCRHFCIFPAIICNKIYFWAPLSPWDTLAPTAKGWQPFTLPSWMEPCCLCNCSYSFLSCLGECWEEFWFPGLMIPLIYL